jgi:hypothetical protein
MLIVCGIGKKGGGKRETNSQAFLEKKKENCKKVEERWRKQCWKDGKLVNAV